MYPPIHSYLLWRSSVKPDAEKLASCRYTAAVSLLPATMVGIFVFGWWAGSIVALSVAAAFLTDFVCHRYIFKDSPGTREGTWMLTGLLIALMLHESGALSQPLLYLSLFFKQHRAMYYELLDRVRTEGDWEAWVDFFLEGVEQTANGAVQTARRLVELFQQDTQRVQNSGRGAANLLRVLDTLRQRPLCSLSQSGKSGGISFPTASKAMLTLVEMGIARELTGRRRNRVFVYDGYLNILNEGGEAL